MTADRVQEYAEETPVEVRYPRSKAEEKGDRAAWPWLPATVLEVCGPDEWRVCIEVPALAVRADGSRATPKTPHGKRYYPCCFRGASEIRPRGGAA
jgi:hypothetical protein